VEVCLTGLPLGWPGDGRHFAHPLDYIGGNGGGGVGAGPGITVGAALALKGSGRVVIGLVGDGDYLMGLTALWTATHYRLPCLLVVCKQPVVLQRRGAPGARRPHAGGGRSRTSGSVSGSTSRTSTWPSGGGAGREGHRPVTDPAKLAGVIAQGVAARPGGRGLRDRCAGAARLRRRHQRRARRAPGAVGRT